MQVIPLEVRLAQGTVNTLRSFSQGHPACYVDLGLGGGGSEAQARGWGLWLKRGGSLGFACPKSQPLPLPAGPGGLGYSQLPAYPPC